jgi:hypothetical protein
VVAGVVLLGGALFGAGDALAEERTLYKWIDSEGRTHFSDRPPAGSVEGIEERSLPVVPAPPPAAAQDYYSVQNQAQRLAEERQARETARQEAARLREEQRLRQAQLEAARAQQEAAEAQRDAFERSQPRYWVPYARPFHPRPRHPFRHKQLREPSTDYTGKFRLPRISSPYRDRRVHPTPRHEPRGREGGRR